MKSSKLWILRDLAVRVNRESVSGTRTGMEIIRKLPRYPYLPSTTPVCGSSKFSYEYGGTYELPTSHFVFGLALGGKPLDDVEMRTFLMIHGK